MYDGACPRESGRQPQRGSNLYDGACPREVAPSPLVVRPGLALEGGRERDTGKMEKDNAPIFRKMQYPVRGTSTWSGLEGYSGQGLEATRWAGVRGCQLSGPGPLVHCGGPPSAPGRGGVRWPGSGPGSAVASSLVRDRWTTQGPVLWTHVGVGEFWRARHLTGVRGG